MYDPVHHAESGKISTLLKAVPAKVCYHFCDTALSSVVICNKSGCSSLDHLGARQITDKTIHQHDFCGYLLNHLTDSSKTLLLFLDLFCYLSLVGPA